jgi:NAD(P)-dependent dehydrogenase (short-subunit alcohol dehydrogenase family)
MIDTNPDPRTLFDLAGRVAVITGGAGLLGRQHGEAIARAGGIPVLADLHEAPAERCARDIATHHKVDAMAIGCDITDEASVIALRDRVLARFGRVDILINNAAKNPKVEDGDAANFSRLETMPVEAWNSDLAVGLTGAFLCSRVLGAEMARAGRGVILNIASDLAVIAPDQRLYREPGRAPNDQPVKPVTYSVVKTGLIGLTRYLATYWAESGVRVNAISPGGVYNGQPDEFVARLAELIPMGRMARIDEYQGVVQFLCSDASAYMTGQNMIVDGGRTAW